MAIGTILELSEQVSTLNAGGRIPMLFQTPCMENKSVGNLVGAYFEAVLCAYVSGIHYVASYMTMEPSEDNDFFRAIPRVHLHDNPTSDTRMISNSIQNNCHCAVWPHECPNALVFTQRHRVRHLWLSIITQFWGNRTLSETFMLRNERQANATILADSAQSNATTLAHSSEGNATILAECDGNDTKTSYPVIPDVAIHYRCSDSTHLGIIPLRAFRDLIPADAKTIYVMTESAHRIKICSELPEQCRRCEAAIQALHKYLKRLFPVSVVLVLRGYDIYVDLLRLTFARRVLICSASTFCLYPALARNTTTYFPVTDLIADGQQVPMGEHFKWLNSSIAPLVKFHAADKSPALFEKVMTELKQGSDSALQ